MAFYEDIKANVVIPKIRQYGALVSLKRQGSIDMWEKFYDDILYEWFWRNTDTGEISSTQPVPVEEVYTGKAIITKYSQEEVNNTTILSQSKNI